MAKGYRRGAKKLAGYKKMNGSSWIRKEKRLAIYIRDNFECVYCVKDLRDANAFDINLDHIICRGEKGSTNEPSNLVTACRACNSSRCDKPLKMFAPAGVILRVKKQLRKSINLQLAKDIIAGKAGKFDN